MATTLEEHTNGNVVANGNTLRANSTSKLCVSSNFTHIRPRFKRIGDPFILIVINIKCRRQRDAQIQAAWSAQPVKPKDSLLLTFVHNFTSNQRGMFIN